MHRDTLSGIPIKGNYPKGKIEKSFQKEFFTFLRKNNWICYHVPDVGLGTKFLDGICISPEGDTVYVEFKKTAGCTFNFSQYEPSQVILLSQLQARKKCEVYTAIFSVRTNAYVLHTFFELLAMRNDKGGCKLFTK